ncbi:hypothetical protein ACFVIX_18810 [Bacillus subtilis]|jgi:hypothetical protein|uniref:Uncharacterized protein n=1 Tax=Bacillus subtilis TaxID=1423 RepID=A0A0D1KE29_BACIU|nr:MULTISPECIES: hypothetical protein [Bacillus subtilis group]AVB12119.1 hypothetical protein C3438_21910 [Bacillus velezensis]AYK76565.1 hypothetical protein D9C12_22740 [Bacillus subtilis subsp. subtilis]AYL03195.1 hypothetical protein D9C08_22895 [Bacillus subtilis subsp. subtilis]KIU04482.1 hypothetical protein SC09_contig8orf00136 [Bacillus subtilis]MCB4341102.1 hypothetical protein [Bacillus subtilis]
MTVTMRTAKGLRVDFSGYEDFSDVFKDYVMKKAINLPLWDEIAEKIEGTEHHKYMRYFTCDVDCRYDEAENESYLKVHFTGSSVLE